MTKTRLHKLTRVYVFEPEAMDLLVIGTAVQGLVNGNSVLGEWVARIRFDQASPTGSPKIKSHQVWAARYCENQKHRAAFNRHISPQDFGGVQKAIQEALGSS